MSSGYTPYVPQREPAGRLGAAFSTDSVSAAQKIMLSAYPTDANPDAFVRYDVLDMAETETAGYSGPFPDDETVPLYNQVEVVLPHPSMTDARPLVFQIRDPKTAAVLADLFAEIAQRMPTRVTMAQIRAHQKTLWTDAQPAPLAPEDLPADDGVDRDESALPGPDAVDAMLVDIDDD